MDPGLLQAIWTLVALTAFLAVVAWAWSARAKRGFEEAARLPLDEDREPAEPAREGDHD